MAKCASNANLSAGNREKARVWVRERAQNFVDVYQNRQDVPTTVLVRLTAAINKLDTQVQHVPLFHFISSVPTRSRPNGLKPASIEIPHNCVM